MTYKSSRSAGAVDESEAGISHILVDEEGEQSDPMQGGPVAQHFDKPSTNTNL